MPCTPEACACAKTQAAIDESAHAVMLLALHGLHMGQPPTLTLIGC